jgi:lipoprotein signal peptidase
MTQVFGLLIAAIFAIFLSFILSTGLISLICYSYFYFKYKSWKYFKRCYLFTLLGGCVGIFITYVLLPRTLDSQVIPYSIIFGCMLAGGFGGVVGKKVDDIT